jgi:hypothetical protein
VWPCRALKSRFRWRSVCLGSGLLAVSAACLDDLVAPSFEDTGNSDPELDQSWWLMNGLYQPTVAMQPGEFQRWRLVTSAVEKGLIVTLHEVSQRRFPPPPTPPFHVRSLATVLRAKKEESFSSTVLCRPASLRAREAWPYHMEICPEFLFRQRNDGRRANAAARFPL